MNEPQLLFFMLQQRTRLAFRTAAKMPTNSHKRPQMNEALDGHFTAAARAK